MKLLPSEFKQSVTCHSCGHSSIFGAFLSEDFFACRQCLYDALYVDCAECHGKGSVWVPKEGQTNYVAGHCTRCKGYGVRAPDFGPLTPTFEELSERSNRPN